VLAEYADGSVHFITENIAMFTLKCIADRADGNAIKAVQ